MSGQPITCLPGERYGRLIVLRDAPKGNCENRRVECKCDCGTVRSFQVSSLRSARAKSCGCLHREVSGAQISKINRTHGEGHGTPEYLTWKGIWDRCTREKSTSYARYGGRGIAVCEEWKSYETFLADMGRKPSPKHSIDRVNSDGPYSKENCRWATQEVQANNTSRNRVLEICGHSKTIAEWSRESGVKQGHIWARLNLGWSPLKAVFEPAVSRKEAMRANQKKSPNARPAVQPALLSAVSQ